jgi:3-dehydroquinate synthase
MQSISVRLKRREQKYEIRIGARLLSEAGGKVRAVLDPKARRVAIISNQTVFDLFGRQTADSLKAGGLKVSHWLLSDGERHKTLPNLHKALDFLLEEGFERSDAVVALGGGVVGDLAGFAAATYLRGISLVQLPTTLLAQIDASVGGKTAVNLAGGKNLAGAFHQPSLVLIDTDTLQTLPRRELTAGWCEGVKQGAIASEKLFGQTCKSLDNPADQDLLAEVIAAQCRFKAAIVAADEREEIGRTDARSRRILNFGHTTAHALELLTRYRRFRHGEAVGHGVLVAGEISKNLGMLSLSELQLLRDAVKLCGRLPRADDLPADQIMKLVTRDKKAEGGTVNWVLLEGIGRPRIVSGREISSRLLRESIRAGLQRNNR